jgi:hypothetical protein
MFLSSIFPAEVLVDKNPPYGCTFGKFAKDSIPSTITPSDVSIVTEYATVVNVSPTILSAYFNDVIVVLFAFVNVSPPPIKEQFVNERESQFVAANPKVAERTGVLPNTGPISTLQSEKVKSVAIVKFIAFKFAAVVPKSLVNLLFEIVPPEKQFATVNGATTACLDGPTAHLVIFVEPATFDKLSPKLNAESSKVTVAGLVAAVYQLQHAFRINSAPADVVVKSYCVPNVVLITFLS